MLILRVTGASAATESIGKTERGGGNCVLSIQGRGNLFFCCKLTLLFSPETLRVGWKKVGSETGWLFAVKIRPL